MSGIQVAPVAKQPIPIIWGIILHLTECRQSWQMVSEEGDQSQFCHKPTTTDGFKKLTVLVF